MSEESGSKSLSHLLDYISAHTERGECQCGRCCDKGSERPAPEHSINVHFFWVSLKGNPSSGELLSILEDTYPDMDRLAGGASYIELGAVLGDQGLALRLIGLGGLVGLWPVITPKTVGFEGADGDEMAGRGFVMAGGFQSTHVRSANAVQSQPAAESPEEHQQKETNNPG